jgi:hypothetical protein
MGNIGVVLGDFVRFALFRPLKGDPAKHWRLYLLVGFALTWMVGFGRYWDNAEAPLWLRSGLTSILYALALSGFIWLIVLGLRPERWSYRNVLLMVLMTALPGIIYAIPVETMMDALTAGALNMIFLAIVAIWRMALYYVFLERVTRLPAYPRLVGWLLPPSIIVAVIGFYGMMYVIAAGMGGVREDVDPNLAAMNVLAFLGLASWVMTPLLMIAYIVFVFLRNRPNRPQ